MNNESHALVKLVDIFKEQRAKFPGNRTKIGILRSLFHSIKFFKNEGYSYGEILETLVFSGLKPTSLNEFYGLMNRIRNEQTSKNDMKSTVVNNLQGSCEFSTNPLYSKKSLITQEKSQADMNSPSTIEEIKTISRSYNLDFTTFD